METKEGKGKIEEVSKKAGAKGPFFHIKIDGKSFSIFDNTDAYIQLDEEQINVGDYTKFDFTESAGTYQGKPVTYKNVQCFEKLAAPKETPKPLEKNMDAVWEAKDKRIVRMNALTQALETFKLNQSTLPKEAQMISEKAIMSLARLYEEWVYREGD